MSRLILALALIVPFAVQAQAEQTVTIEEWTVPWPDTRPRDPTVTADGDIWFVGQVGNYLAHFDPDTEEFTKFDLPEGTGPHTVIAGQSGDLWIAGNRDAYIGRFDRETEELTRIPMPNPEARDPHTLAQAPDGTIWFTVQGSNFVGALDPETHEIELIPVPTPQALPYGIVVNDQGSPYIALLGANKLATVDPETMEITEIALPREEARPRRIALTPDGMVWYVDYAESYLGRYNPETGEFTEWRSPSGDQGKPYGMAADAHGHVWYVETGPQPNLFVGFDPQTETFMTTPIPSGAGAVRHMVYDPEREAIWFGTDANTLGKATLP